MHQPLFSLPNLFGMYVPLCGAERLHFTPIRHASVPMNMDILVPKLEALQIGPKTQNGDIFFEICCSDFDEISIIFGDRTSRRHLQENNGTHTRGPVAGYQFFRVRLYLSEEFHSFSVLSNHQWCTEQR